MVSRIGLHRATNDEERSFARRRCRDTARRQARRAVPHSVTRSVSDKPISRKARVVSRGVHRAERKSLLQQVMQVIPSQRNAAYRDRSVAAIGKKSIGKLITFGVLIVVSAGVAFLQFATHDHFLTPSAQATTFSSTSLIRARAIKSQHEGETSPIKYSANEIEASQTAPSQPSAWATPGLNQINAAQISAFEREMSGHALDFVRIGSGRSRVVSLDGGGAKFQWLGLSPYTPALPFKPVIHVNHPTGDTGNAYPFSQCTWWAYIRRHQLGLPCGSHFGNGGQWANSARRLGYEVNHTPSVGAIMVFAPGQDGASPTYGHVAIVEAVMPDGSVITSECGAVLRGHPISRRIWNVQKFWFIHN